MHGLLGLAFEVKAKRKIEGGFVQAEESISNHDHRLQRILFLLKKRNRVSVNELSPLLGVSQVTVRADLAELEKQGLVIRNYGGATLVGTNSDTGVLSHLKSPVSTEAPLGAAPKGAALAESHSMALKAYSFISEGDSVFLDASAESKLLAELLCSKRGITVLTNSLEIASVLARKSGISVYLSGGRLSEGSFFISKEEWPFGDLGLTKAFVSAWGATSEDGYEERRTEEAQLKRAALQRAGERYVFLRSNRWGSKSLCSFAPIEGVDAVFSDAGAGKDLELALRKHEVRLEKASATTKTDGAYSVFESFKRDASVSLMYEGRPGKGKRLAFANENRSESFCRRVEEGLLKNAVLAGFAEEDILVLDNNYDTDRAIQNAREIIQWGADVAIEFNADFRSNNVIADLFKKAGLASVAIDGALPSATFVGANNWQAGSMAGDHARTLIESKFGGWQHVDALILVEMPLAGELVLLRTEAFAASLEAAYGDEVDNKTIRVDGGNRYSSGKAAIASILGKIKKDGNYVLTAVNVKSLLGGLDALKEAGLWSEERFISIAAHGEEETVRTQLNESSLDAAVLFYPEKYGEAAIPAACALLKSAPLPPYLYIDSSLVVREHAQGS
ncbi:hypothetical protein MASR2M78_27850 [Treponema sp.]